MKKGLFFAVALLMLSHALVLAIGDPGDTRGGRDNENNNIFQSPEDRTYPTQVPADSSLDNNQPTRPQKANNTKKLFRELDEFLQQKNSSSFIIFRNGRIVHEKYFNGSKASDMHKIFSAGKSVTAVLVFQAAEKKLLNLSDPVSKYLPGWAKCNRKQEKRITIEHVLTMTSGLNDRRRYVTEPGREWRYNTGTYHVLHDLLPRVTGKSMQQLSDEWLFKTMKCEKEFKFVKHTWEATARGLQKFGQLMLNQGLWKRKRLISAASFAKMTSTSQRLNLSYGYLWWLNGKLSGIAINKNFVGSLVPAAPADMFCALGKDDQKIYVIPSLSAVVVRQGDSADTNRSELTVSSFDNELWIKLMGILDAHNKPGRPKRFVPAGGDFGM